MKKPELIIDSFGNKCWYFNGKLHREDGPAVEYADGGKSWWLNGEYHRIDGPAVEWGDGTEEWYLNGKLHRIDGPAIEFINGNKKWYLNGKEVKKEDVIINAFLTEREYINFIIKNFL